MDTAMYQYMGRGNTFLSMRINLNAIVKIFKQFPSLFANKVHVQGPKRLTKAPSKLELWEKRPNVLQHTLQNRV